MKKQFLFILAVFLWSYSSAQTVDGVLGMTEYPSMIGGMTNPVSLQENPTGFGDNQSELNGLYVGFDDNNLYLLFTGNLEGNFNKLELFIDSEPGGQNTIAPPNPMFDITDALNTTMVGLTFDPTFFPDHVLTFGHDGSTGLVNFASLGTMILQSSGSGSIASIVTSNGIQLALDNSNTGGVSDVAVNDPASVITGIEISIPLSEINSAPGNDVKIMAAVNNGDHNFLSNQSLPPLPFGTDNLGGDGSGGFTGTLSGVKFWKFYG